MFLFCFTHAHSVTRGGWEKFFCNFFPLIFLHLYNERKQRKCFDKHEERTKWMNSICILYGFGINRFNQHTYLSYFVIISPSFYFENFDLRAFFPLRKISRYWNSTKLHFWFETKTHTKQEERERERELKVKCYCILSFQYHQNHHYLLWFGLSIYKR